MAKVTEENLLGIHVRAARALLGMSARQFAEYAGNKLTTDKVKSIESGRPTHHRTRTEMIKAIVGAGIELQNGGKPGARVKDVEAFRLASNDSRNS